MDYRVFLPSRIREQFPKTKDNDFAVTFGITSTARIITGAAFIMIAVFAGFAAGVMIMFQQLGFGVAAALLIDANLRHLPTYSLRRYTERINNLNIKRAARDLAC